MKDPDAEKPEDWDQSFSCGRVGFLNEMISREVFWERPKLDLTVINTKYNTNKFISERFLDRSGWVEQKF